MAGRTKLSFWLAMLEDISVLKREEIMLEQMAAITEASGDAIFRSDLNMDIEFWGKGAERLYGYTPEEILGRPVGILHDGVDSQNLREAVAKIRNGETIFDPSSRGRHKDGHLIPISVQVYPIKDKAKRIVAYAATHRDISEMKQMEGQLLHAQRMETAGLLAGGVAHDFNNILTVILGSSTLLRS